MATSYRGQQQRPPLLRGFPPPAGSFIPAGMAGLLEHSRRAEHQPGRLHGKPFVIRSRPCRDAAGRRWAGRLRLVRSDGDVHGPHSDQSLCGDGERRRAGSGSGRHQELQRVRGPRVLVVGVGRGTVAGDQGRRLRPGRRHGRSLRLRQSRSPGPPRQRRPQRTAGRTDPGSWRVQLLLVRFLEELRPGGWKRCVRRPVLELVVRVDRVLGFAVDHHPVRRFGEGHRGG